MGNGAIAECNGTSLYQKRKRAYIFSLARYRR